MCLDRSEMGNMAVKMLDYRINSKGENVPSVLVHGTFMEGCSIAEIVK